MKFNYDTVADAAYLNVNEGKVVKTVEMNDGVVVDLGEKGKIIGIEILNFSVQHSLKKLQEAVQNGLPVQIVSSTPIAA